MEATLRRGGSLGETEMRGGRIPAAQGEALKVSGSAPGGRTDSDQQGALLPPAPGHCPDIWNPIPFTSRARGASSQPCSRQLLRPGACPFQAKTNAPPGACTPVSDGRRKARNGSFDLRLQFPHPCFSRSVVSDSLPPYGL